ncbi:hypothetical protein BOX15_Mlig000830g1 [Macrostomum lignano]|uniref:C2 NT-type domain-containing protein n=1 Tax=Macrostomum lignano TaxID=282301 RepID=A0A267EGS8_9PLAT|nr:hypothetical protein BOX15_Mlig000830g1 [Macrostomum lignano]
MLCCSRPSLSGRGQGRSPRKQRVQLQLIELEGVTLSNGVLFAKVRLLSGGRFCAYSTRREIRDNKVAWSDQGPMEFACHLGGPGPPIVLRVSVRKEERGGRSYSKLGFAVLNLTELLGSNAADSTCSTAAEHSCILSPYNQRQRLDNSTLRLGVRRLAAVSQPVANNNPHGVAASVSVAMATTATAAAATSATCSNSVKPLDSTDIALATADHLIAPTAMLLESSAVPATAPGAHCRNPSGFSYGSLRTHSRTNSVDQDVMIPAAGNSSQTSSAPSFDLHLPSSLERKRAALTSARELNSRIANTRTDNFEIVREVLEQEGIRIAGLGCQ